ncbi:MAG: hypothetical protein A2293_05310 [Elusimicrobia bacterium RIFOXYB2_FULL_49_7]|nr:MAG: hypothetical protein A2293_05310 [Elusimicrobia bacterium RIFOXYB2_FULL_49_7]
MGLCRLACFLFLTALPLLAADHEGASIEEHRRELDQVKQELEESRQHVKRLENQETDVITQLKSVDKNLSLTQRYVRKLSDMESVLKTDVDSISGDLTHTLRELRRRKAFLRERVRWIYMKGRYRGLDVLLSSGSLSNLLHRSAFYKAITDNDHRLISNIFAQQRRIEDKKTDLEIRLADVKNIAEEKKREQKRFEDQKQDRKHILSKVKKEKSGLQKLVAELEKRQAQINEIIAALEKARKAKKKDRRETEGPDLFSRDKGDLPWPVKGRILKKFGTIVHPEYGTKTLNNGIDISAGKGEKVRAVAAGEVVYTGHLPGFGRFLIVSHISGYYSLYGNLASVGVRKGETLRQNDPVGTAGETEVSDTPQIHFELRQERKILNPLSWLSTE